MIHQANWYRADIVQGISSQEIDGYANIAYCVPCFIQPADSKEAFYYSQRGDENTHTIYTTSQAEFLRNDILERNGDQFHIVGVKDALYMGLYQELAVYQYSESAKRRLNWQAYE